MRENLSVLRHSGFRRLFAARSISVLGSAIAPVALAFAVLDLPGATASTLGLVLAAQVVPQIVFILLGGVVADRFPRARVMVAADLLAGSAELALGGLFLTGHAQVPLLMGLAAVNGVATALFFPSITGLIPQVVPERQLQAANGLLRLTMNLARILGTALAGVRVATAGSGQALLVDGGTFLVSAALLGGIAVPATERVLGSTMFHELRVGWREFVGRRWVWVIVLSFSVANMALLAVFGVLGPVRSKASYGGASSWATILVAESVGMVVGVAVALRIRPKHPMRLAMIVVLVEAIPITLLAGAQPVWSVALAAFATGISIDIFSVLWDTALQQHVPLEVLSRVSAYDWLGSLLLGPLGLVLAGGAAGLLGLRPALLLCAGLVVVPVLLSFLSPDVRNLPAQPPAQPADGA